MSSNLSFTNAFKIARVAAGVAGLVTIAILGFAAWQQQRDIIPTDETVSPNLDKLSRLEEVATALRFANNGEIDQTRQFLSFRLAGELVRLSQTSPPTDTQEYLTISFIRRMALTSEESYWRVHPDIKSKASQDELAIWQMVDQKDFTRLALANHPAEQK